jgi:hypothetical protein
MNSISIVSAMDCPFGLCSPAQIPVRFFRLASRAQLVLEEYEQFLHRSGHPIRLVDHQGVAWLECVEHGA